MDIKKIDFKKFFNQQKHIIIAVVAGLTVVGISLTVMISRKNADLVRGASTDQPGQEIIIPTPDPKKKTLSVLLLGYGGPGHQGGSLADVIQVVHLDFDTNTTNLISIPRDLWISLPNGTKSKINSAYAMDLGSGAENASITKSMAQIVTGLPIEYFVAVDFVGFERIIGIKLKGLEVKISETLDDPWYPIKGEELNTCGKSPEEVALLTSQLSGFSLEKQFECRYEHIYYEPGTHLMQGHDALAFVRSRHGSAGGDFARGIRQQELLEAIRKELFSLKNIDNIPAIYKEFSGYVNTDLDLEAAKYVWPSIKLTKNNSVNKININTSNVLVSGKGPSGQYIVQPKSSWQDVQNFVQNGINQN